MDSPLQVILLACSATAFHMPRPERRRPTRASDVGLWRRQRCSRRLEHYPSQCRTSQLEGASPPSFGGALLSRIRYRTSPEGVLRVFDQSEVTSSAPPALTAAVLRTADTSVGASSSATSSTARYR